MRIRIEKSAADLVVRIPNALAEQAGIREGDEFELIVESARLTMRSVRKRRMDLHALLAGIREDNLRPAVDFGPREGLEAW